MLISVVIPCYRSAKTIERVVEEIKKEILKREGNTYQIILINDCSPDETFSVIRKMAEADQNIIGIDLGRNYGQNNARIASVPYIKGDVAVCMDDDGQHPADQIYRLVDKVQEGYDLVYAKFAHQKQTVFRRFSSRANTALLELTGAKMKGISNSPFLAWSRFSIDALKAYHSPFVSAGAYLMRCTNRVANVEMEQRARMEGHSGYTLKKLINLWLTEFTNFSLVPLRLAGILGFSLVFFGIIFGIVAVIHTIAHPEISSMDYVLLMALLLTGGIILLILGLMGEYLGKIYMTISEQPQTVIREVVTKHGEDRRD